MSKTTALFEKLYGLICSGSFLNYLYYGFFKELAICKVKLVELFVAQ